MRKIIVLVSFALIIILLFLWQQRNSFQASDTFSKNNWQEILPKEITKNDLAPEKINDVSGAFWYPLDRANERVTKKPFGIFVTPQNSPVSPEKFRGYHTGTDFEIFPEELNADVPIKAVCSGKLTMKKYATGYGGVAVESCEFDGQPITVIYGHLKLTSILANTGDEIKAGGKIGILGKAFSQETSGERKHLHLGFHKESVINILGYVQNQNELSGWIDPCLSVCRNQ